MISIMKGTIIMKEKDVILKELLEIKAKVDALVLTLQSAKNASVTASIEEVRKIAVIEEVYRLGGTATPNEISEIAKKWGKSPSSTAGYYSGNSPSLEACVNSNGDAIRRLTAQGVENVKRYRAEWGEDWLDRVQLEIVGNFNTKTTEISF